MNWGEFKKKIEESGVNDSSKIDDIQDLGSEPEANSFRVAVNWDKSAFYIVCMRRNAGPLQRNY